MADFLLVSDAGHGSWCWGRVWGHLTAPSEHPPRLSGRPRVGQVVALDILADRGRANREPENRAFDSLVSTIAGKVRSQGLTDVVMAGHGLAAPALIRAAAELEVPPRRIVLFAGIIPGEGKSALDALPRVNKLVLKMLVRMNRLARKEVKLPKPVITNVYCNGMDPFDAIQIIGRFTSLPRQLFESRVYLDDLARDCPVTYVPLWRDRLVPAQTQRRMAQRMVGTEVVPELDTCHEAMIESPRQVAEILLRYA